MNRERFETKLFIPRNVDDEPNTQEIAEIRKLEEELSNNPAFIGIAPFGSVMTGYSNEQSDIDARILYDADMINDRKKFDTAKNFSKSSNEKINTKITVISLSGLLEKFSYWVNHEQASAIFGIGLASMTGIVTGKKINKYREAIREQIGKLNLEEQKKLENIIMDNLIEMDGASLLKRSERMPELTEADQQEILEKRKEMWRERVKRVWGL